MDYSPGFPLHEIIIRIAVGIVFSVVSLACRQSVAKHLLDVPDRHFHRLQLSCFRVIVRPIFKVMAVPALMVHPRHRISRCFSFGFVGTSVTLKILCSGDKLRRRILRQIVPKPLEKYTCPDTVRNDLVPVFCDCNKMFDRVHNRPRYLMFVKLAATSLE